MDVPPYLHNAIVFNANSAWMGRHVETGLTPNPTMGPRPLTADRLRRFHLPFRRRSRRSSGKFAPR